MLGQDFWTFFNIQGRFQVWVQPNSNKKGKVRNKKNNIKVYNLQSQTGLVCFGLLVPHNQPSPASCLLSANSQASRALLNLSVFPLKKKIKSLQVKGDLQ